MKIKNVEETLTIAVTVIVASLAMIAYRVYWLKNNKFENDE